MLFRIRRFANTYRTMRRMGFDRRGAVLFAFDFATGRLHRELARIVDERR